MGSLADGLPPEIAAQVHPEWRANEAAYWAARDTLLTGYQGQWVAFADGAVVASGPSPVEVLRAAAVSGRHPFVTRVGAEDQPTRMRRASFPYDTAYPGEPLPQLAAEFRATSGTPGVLLDRVIPDTGADASAVPWSDCQAMGFDPSQGTPGLIGGGPAAPPQRWCSSPGSGSTGRSTRANSRPTSQAPSGFSDGTFSTAWRFCSAGRRVRLSSTRNSRTPPVTSRSPARSASGGRRGSCCPRPLRGPRPRG